MRILALDTATENCSVALMLDGSLLGREEELDRGHAERILGMIDELLAQGGVSLTRLDAIAFGRGPGSFTGVRLAASITQGLSFGAGIGVVPISDLRALAQRALGEEPHASRVLACSDARMGEVYWACFERDAEGLVQCVGAEHVGKPDTVVLAPTWDAGVVGAGRGFAAHPALAQLRLERVFPGLLPRALEIASLAAPVAACGQCLAPEEAIPVYLRDDVVRARPPS